MNFIINRSIHIWFLVALFLLSLLILAHGHYTSAAVTTTPIAYFLTAMIIGIYPIIILNKKQFKPVSGTKKKLPQRVVYISLVAFVAMAALMAYQYNLTLAAYPIDPKLSDVIPQIEVLVRRFLSGEFAYVPITEFGWEMRSPYLPLHWIPFAIPDIVGMDYRWFAFGAFLMATMAILVRLFRQKSLPLFIFVGLGLLPVAMLLTSLYWVDFIYGTTVELMFVSFYLFLGLVITRKSPYILAIAIVLCLLSRYALIFWIPFFFLLLWIFNQRRTVIITSLVCMAAVVLIYILPFLSQDWGIFMDGINSRNEAIKVAWTYEGFYRGGYPSILYRGVGLGIYFFKELGAESGLNTLKIVQLVTSILVLLIATIIYPKIKSRVPLRFYGLAMLYLSLVMLYHFGPLPYLYLMLVPTGLSIAVIVEFAGILYKPAADVAEMTSIADPKH